MISVRDAVVPDDRQMPPDSEPAPPGGAVEAERRGIDREHDRGRRPRQREQGFGGLLALVRHERIGANEPGILLDTRAREPAAKAVQPQPAVLVAATAVDEGDAAMAERRQAPDGVRHRVLGTDVVPGATGRVPGPAEHHERHVLAAQQRDARVLDQRARQDESIDLVLVEEPPHGGERRRFAVGGRYRDGPALAARHEGDPGQKVGEKRPVGVVIVDLDDQAQRARPAGADRLRVAERAVAHPRRGAAYPLPGRRRDVGIAVEGPGYGALGQPQRRRHVGDRDSRAAPAGRLSLSQSLLVERTHR